MQFSGLFRMKKYEKFRRLETIWMSRYKKRGIRNLSFFTDDLNYLTRTMEFYRQNLKLKNKFHNQQLLLHQQVFFVLRAKQLLSIVAMIAK